MYNFLYVHWCLYIFRKMTIYINTSMVKHTMIQMKIPLCELDTDSITLRCRKIYFNRFANFTDETSFNLIKIIYIHTVINKWNDTHYIFLFSFSRKMIISQWKAKVYRISISLVPLQHTLQHHLKYRYLEYRNANNWMRMKGFFSSSFKQFFLVVIYNLYD